VVRLNLLQWSLRLILIGCQVPIKFMVECPTSGGAVGVCRGIAASAKNKPNREVFMGVAPCKPLFRKKVPSAAVGSSVLVQHMTVINR